MSAKEQHTSTIAARRVKSASFKQLIRRCATVDQNVGDAKGQCKRVEEAGMQVVEPTGLVLD